MMTSWWVAENSWPDLCSVAVSVVPFFALCFAFW